MEFAFAIPGLVRHGALQSRSLQLRLTRICPGASQGARDISCWDTQRLGAGLHEAAGAPWPPPTLWGHSPHRRHNAVAASSLPPALAAPAGQVPSPDVTEKLALVLHTFGVRSAKAQVRAAGVHQGWQPAVRSGCAGDPSSTRPARRARLRSPHPSPPSTCRPRAGTGRAHHRPGAPAHLRAAPVPGIRSQPPGRPGGAGGDQGRQQAPVPATGESAGAAGGGGGGGTGSRALHAAR